MYVWSYQQVWILKIVLTRTTPSNDQNYNTTKPVLKLIFYNKKKLGLQKRKIQLKRLQIFSLSEM